MAASALFFSLMSLLVKVAGDRLPSHQIVLVRAVICLGLSYGWLRLAGVAVWGTNRRLLLLRGVLGTGSLLCFYYSLVELPFAEAVVIQYLAPVLTAGLAAAMLAERPSRRLIAALVCSIGGVLAITRPPALFGGAAADLPPLGVAAALVGALVTALVFVLVRRLGDREDPLVVVFYFPLCAVPLVAPLAVRVWVWPTAFEWLVLAGVGVATQLAQVHMTRGLQLEPAGRASSTGYLQVVLAAIWGALFFDEVPDGLAMAGSLLIVGATLALALSPRERPATDRAMVDDP